MFYVGLDIHTKHISICVLSEKGQVVLRSQVRGIAEMLNTVQGLTDRFEVCYEASCGYGHYHDLLRPLASRVLVAHPGQLRLIFRSKNKNDRNDAERLAKLLYLGETPTVHVPSVEVRTWRELINCRSQVIAKRTRAKNTIRALLRSGGIRYPEPETGTLCLWDAATGKEVHRMRAHDKGVMAVGFTPDGKRLLSAGSSNENTVRVWDRESGKEIRSHEYMSANGVPAVAFTRDGRHVLSAPFYSDLSLFDLETGKRLERFANGGGRTAAISADGRLAATASDRVVRLWGLPKR